MSERLLAGELIVTELIVTGRELSAGRAPKPHQYVAALIAFGMLSALGLLGPAEADLAAKIGALVVLVALLSAPAMFVWLSKVSGGAGPKVVQAPSKKTSSGGGLILGALPIAAGDAIGSFVDGIKRLLP